MKKFLGLITLLMFATTLGLAACGESKFVKKAQDIEKKACSCKDMDCVKEVRKMLSDFQKEAGNKKVKKADADKIKKAMDNAIQCLAKNSSAIIKSQIKEKMKKKEKK